VNRVVLIGVAGLLVLAAAIALNYWNGREPGDEPVVAGPTGVPETTAATGMPSTETEDPGGAQEATAGGDAPSASEQAVATEPLSAQGTDAAQANASAAAEAPAAGSGTPSEPSVAGSPAPPADASDKATDAQAIVGDQSSVRETELLGASEQVTAQAPVSTPDSAPDPAEPSASSPESAGVEPSATSPETPAATVVEAEEPAAIAQEAIEVAEIAETRTADAAPVAEAAANGTELAPAETQAAAVDAATGREEAPGTVVSPEAVEVQPQAPSFDVVRINSRGNAVLAGRAEPDTEVVIRDGGQEIGRVMADTHGEWVFVPTEPLPPGSRELSLSARRGLGTAVLSQETVVLVVPEPGKDIAGEVTGGAPTGTLALQIPRVSVPPVIGEAPAPTKVLQTPSGEEPAPEELALRAIDYSGSGQLVLSGNAPSGSRLQVYLDDSLIGIAEAREGGAWNLVPEGSVEAGVYTMRVDQVDAAGKVISRIELPFARAEPVAALPKETIVVVQPGNSLWQIARRTYGAGINYTVIYDLNRDQIRDPHLIYPGQIFTLERIN
jgi:nucleoid-associated protein YgaU